MEQSEREAIEAAETYLRPPDEPHAGGGDDWHLIYGQAIEFLKDAVAALEDDRDPEDALRCAREAIGRIEAVL